MKETVYYLIMSKLYDYEDPVSGLVWIARPTEGVNRFFNRECGALVEVDKIKMLTHLTLTNHNKDYKWSWIPSAIEYVIVKEIDGLENLIDFIIKNREIFQQKDLDLINGLVIATIGSKS